MQYAGGAKESIGEVQLGGTLGAPPADRKARVILFDDGYKFGVVSNFDVSLFVEVYATGPDVALGTGALWAFTRDMQVDLGTYVGLTGNEPVATPFLGFSIRR